MKKVAITLATTVLATLSACNSPVTVGDEAYWGKESVHSKVVSKWPHQGGIPRSALKPVQTTKNEVHKNNIDLGKLGFQDKIEVEFLRVPFERAPIKGGESLRAKMTFSSEETARIVERGIKCTTGLYSVSRDLNNVVFDFQVDSSGKCGFELNENGKYGSVRGLTWNEAKESIQDFLENTSPSFLQVNLEKLEQSPYLASGDQIEIRVSNLPEGEDPLSATATVFQNSIRFHPLGKIEVQNKSIEDIQIDISAGIQKTYSLAVVTVLLKKQGAKPSQYLESLADSSLGRVRTYTIRRPGLISIPGLPNPISAVGMSPIELQRIINGAMASEFGPIEVNLRLTHDEIDNYSIAGQVRQPGVYPIKGEVTLVEALSTAGWVDDSADLQKIVLISKGPDSELTNGGGEMIGTASSADGGTSTVVLYDVDSALHRGYGLPDVLVRPEDIIMVPRTGAGDVMHWIDQHLPSSILLPLSNVYKVAGT